ncbi:hypothetical protein FT643_20465 [Ketobacter sp. MCCC 1A13808]|uniref:hypothetical protein n=1 Tax=Ketobacter sp. MCCC 1A13808 TaxID=2602738 RepID=UPI0012EB7BB2|nr:hypothetical protein [Ketobacter sp. MCCC 1A13808]MVF14515.1 hypothetical protein [Ketobacter sp. MCCC 1A13808]
MMEYLEMRGAVKLKANADKAVVRSVLSKLRETEFVDAGYIDIGIEENTLSISAEGTIVNLHLNLTRLLHRILTRLIRPIMA